MVIRTAPFNQSSAAIIAIAIISTATEMPLLPLAAVLVKSDVYENVNQRVGEQAWRCRTS